MQFICNPCKKGDHEGCLQGTWCECQHKAPK